MDRACILIVENERIVAEDIRLRLTSMGYGICGCVPSGPIAIECVKNTCKSTKVDLVLMDIRLEGDMSGIEAGNIIRRDYHTPVVFLTAYGDEATIEEATSSEPYGYLLKPFQDRELRAAVEVALYKHSKERQLQERERWLWATLNSMADGVIATDTNGNILLMNPTAESLTGHTRQAAESRPIEDVFAVRSGTSGERIKNPLRQALRNDCSSEEAFEGILETADGNEIPIASTYSPICNGEDEMTGVIVVFRDITARKQAEQARRDRETLEMNERHQRTIGQYLHDSLGQNLTAIACLAKTLERSSNSPDDSVSEAATEIIELAKSTTQLTRSLTRGLCPAGIGVDGLMTALHETAADTERLFGISCTFHCDEPVPVADSTAATNLFFIVREAINNAVKHSHGKNIRIQLSLLDQCAALSIADNGTGLSENIGGPGLGLSIMKRRAETIGGTLNIKPVRGKGTTVECRFPLIQTTHERQRAR